MSMLANRDTEIQEKDDRILHLDETISVLGDKEGGMVIRRKCTTGGVNLKLILMYFLPFYCIFIALAAGVGCHCALLGVGLLGLFVVSVPDCCYLIYPEISLYILYQG